MRVVPNSLFASGVRGGSPFSAGGSGGRLAALRQRIMEQRMNDQRREMQIRERENQIINDLHERITLIKESDDSGEAKRAMISGIIDRIAQIHENRAERELLAVEREMQRQKTLLEEIANATEEEHNQNAPDRTKDPEEAEKERERQFTVGMTRIAVGKDNIRNLKRTRAALEGRAGHLRRAIGSPNSNSVKTGSYPYQNSVEVIISVRSGHGDDFRNHELARFNEGIARTSAAIDTKLGRLFRQTADMQRRDPAARPWHTDKDDEDPATVSVTITTPAEGALDIKS